MGAEGNTSPATRPLREWERGLTSGVGERADLGRACADGAHVLSSLMHRSWSARPRGSLRQPELHLPCAQQDNLEAEGEVSSGRPP